MNCIPEDEAEKLVNVPFATMEWGDGKAQPLETIDITPVGCQTPEGNAKVNAAKDEWDSATHAVANAIKECIDDLFDRNLDKITHAELYSELQTLIGIKDVKQEAFLRAISGR